MDSPILLISSWMAVIPFRVPVILKSISPQWSSIPAMSVNKTYLSASSEIIPIEIPATLSLIGTPASISERVEPQVEAIEEEPF